MIAFDILPFLLISSLVGFSIYGVVNAALWLREKRAACDVNDDPAARKRETALYDSGEYHRLPERSSRKAA